MLLFITGGVTKDQLKEMIDKYDEEYKDVQKEHLLNYEKGELRSIVRSVTTQKDKKSTISASNQLLIWWFQEVKLENLKSKIIEKVDHINVNLYSFCSNSDSS